MAMTLLEIVQEFCDRRALPRPTVVMGSSEDAVKQIRGLLNETLTDITNRGHSWKKLQKQATFTSVAAELQGTLASVAPYGFKYVIPDTLFDRTDRRPLFGPRAPSNWQESEALPVTGPLYTWRIWQGNFYIQPAIAAGHTIAFEYASDMAILDADGATWKKRYAVDTDVFQLDEDLLLLGLNWKWRREQGLSYAQEKSDYEALVTQIIGVGSDKGAVSLGGAQQTVAPGIFVPLGNWNVS